MATESMLTTIDNPHNPFEEFDAWYEFDTRLGHNTLNYLARIVVTSDDLSEADQDLAIERAIAEIVDLNINGQYKRISRSFEITGESPVLGEI